MIYIVIQTHDTQRQKPKSFSKIAHTKKKCVAKCVNTNLHQMKMSMFFVIEIFHTSFFLSIRERESKKHNVFYKTWFFSRIDSKFRYTQNCSRFDRHMLSKFYILRRALQNLLSCQASYLKNSQNSIWGQTRRTTMFLDLTGLDVF